MCVQNKRYMTKYRCSIRLWDFSGSSLLVLQLMNDCWTQHEKIEMILWNKNTCSFSSLIARYRFSHFNKELTTHQTFFYIPSISFLFNKKFLFADNFLFISSLFVKLSCGDIFIKSTFRKQSVSLAFHVCTGYFGDI